MCIYNLNNKSTINKSKIMYKLVKKDIKNKWLLGYFILFVSISI